ncbi:MAG: hypothetical protein ACYCW6_18385 [Candidatus Xenobia bacterium]
MGDPRPADPADGAHGERRAGFPAYLWSPRLWGVTLLLLGVVLAGARWMWASPPRIMLDMPLRLLAGERAALHLLTNRPGLPVRILLESDRGPNWEPFSGVTDEHGALPGSWMVPRLSPGTYRLRVLVDGRTVGDAPVEVLRQRHGVLWTSGQHWKPGDRPLVCAQFAAGEAPPNTLFLLEDASGATLASTRVPVDHNGLTWCRFQVPPMRGGYYWLQVSDTEMRLPIAVGVVVGMVSSPPPTSTPDAGFQVGPTLLGEGDELSIRAPRGKGLLMLDLLQDDRLLATRVVGGDVDAVSWRLQDGLRGLISVRGSRVSPDGVGRVVGTARVVVRPPAPFIAQATRISRSQVRLHVMSADGRPLIATVHVACRSWSPGAPAVPADPSFPWSLPGRIGIDLIEGSPLGADLAALPESMAPVNLVEAAVPGPGAWPSLAALLVGLLALGGMRRRRDLGWIAAGALALMLALLPPPRFHTPETLPPPSIEPALPAPLPTVAVNDGPVLLAWLPSHPTNENGDVVLAVPPGTGLLDVLIVTRERTSVCRVRVACL